MTEFLEKSMATLELPRILAMLADMAVTEEGKDKVLALRPITEMSDVKYLLEETTAAVEAINTKGSPSFSGIKPVGSALLRAEMGGTLNTRELLSIAAVLRSSRVAKEYGERESEKSVIDHLFYRLHVHKYLEEKIGNTIVGEDEIADSASGELMRIRRLMRATAGKVRDILNKLISTDSKYLQESIITMRGGRYVVPVKSEHKNDVAGLVHDISGSGSTFFVEPIAVVKVNNELRELQAREEKEIERILAELSAEAAAIKSEVLENYQLLIFLDVIFAKGKLSIRMKALAPLLSERTISLKKARHPLLDQKTAVANDILLGEDFDTLMITGPNTGGKTVTLKTLGLLTLMTQCGLHIPVEDGSFVAVCSRVWADIGDEQSIAQSLSTFSSHMTNIVKMLEYTDDRSLILFDELGAGTDPVEGAALAISIIERASQLGALVAATTHYAELKVYATTTPRVQNASCEFNVETLAPTYRLMIGIPGKSNAFAISQRLGLPKEMIDRAAERMQGESVQFEDVLHQLELKQRELESEKEKARVLRIDAENAQRKAKNAQDKAEKELSTITDLAREEAREIIEDARREADAVMRELKELRRSQAKQSDWQKVNEQRAGLRGQLNRAEEKLGQKKEVAPPPMVREAVVGDTVLILKTGTEGQVVSAKQDGSLQLQAGILKISAKQEEVRVVEGESKTKKEAQKYMQKSAHQLRSLGARPEIDLRGMMSDEAEGALGIFMDQAMMGNLTQATIIHGKGTGVLRKMVHQNLKRLKYVKSYRLGRYGEGEDGVTIVELK